MLGSTISNPGVRPSTRFICNILASGLALVLCGALATSTALAQNTAPHARITAAVDNSRTVALAGNTHPLARAEFDQGAAPDSLAAERMLLLLSRSPDQQAELDKLLQDQQTPSSPNFHNWLTPSDFATKFGPAASDLQQVTAWLQAQGFTVANVGAGNMVIEFTGTAGQVRNAFHTQIHKYRVNGMDRWANASDPRIPAAFAPVVSGVVSLNDFPRQTSSRRLGTFTRDRDGTVTPAFTLTNGSNTHYYAMAPADFATIYNTNPLLTAGNNGAGQTIAIVGRTNIHLQDIADFRSMFGMGAGNTSVVIDGIDPGIVDGDETESLLDLEWSNAVAPGATIVLVSAQSTATTSGIDLAALHVLNNNMAGVMSLSYGNCERNLGNTGNQFIQSIFQQAAAQGITVVVSSGDSGSAGCDDQNLEYVATAGLAVNGLASTPYNVAVGGTDFNDLGTQTTYWKSTNDPTTLGSALSYIPETTWNETCAAVAGPGALSVCPQMPASGTPDPSLSLWSGSGGASSCTASTTSGTTVTCTSGTPKPAWQTGAGVPNDSVRDIPDVSLFAAGGSASHSFYVVCEADALPPGYQSCGNASGNFLGVGGTSASAPSFAAIVALAEQKSGTRLGNLNYQLYPLAAGSGASCPSTSATSTTGCIFNDVINGNNTVPCKAGTPNCSVTSGALTGVLIDSSNNPTYMAKAGFDLATGLGSVNATNLVNGIANAIKGFTPTTSALTLNGATAPVTAAHGASIAVGVTLTPASGGSVALEGTNSAFDSNPLVAGSAVWSSTLFPGGIYTVKAHYAGDGQHGASDSNGVPVTITPENSQTFLDLIRFDPKTGQVTSFNGNNVPYGSPYIMRMTVADTAATDPSATGVSSKCSDKTASCPTGTVTVTANGQPLDGGSYKLNILGVSEDLPIQLSPGSVTLAANYSGDPSYNANTATKSLTIVKAPTTLALTLPIPPYQYGVPASVVEAVSTTSNGAAPTGTFSATDNGVAPTYFSNTYFQTYPGNSSGYASLTAQSAYTPVSVGSHTLVVQYSGDPLYQTSSATPVVLNVVPAVMDYNYCSISPSLATNTMPVAISCYFGGQLAGPPTGTIAISDNGTPMTGTLTYQSGSGSAGTRAFISGSFNPTFSQTGGHSITAVYSGDTNYATVNTFGFLSVFDKVPPNFGTVYFTWNTVIPNFSFQVSAYVQSPDNALPAPTGTFTFYDNGQAINITPTYTTVGKLLNAVIQYAATSTGAHVLSATYSGDSIFATESIPGQNLSVVDKFPTTLSTSGYQATVNLPTPLTAYVSSPIGSYGPNMTGTVTFSEGGTPLAGTPQVTNTNGSLQALLNYTFTTLGTHNIAVQYSGDSSYAASQLATPTAISVVGPLVVQLQSKTLNVNYFGGVTSVPFSVANNTGNSMLVAITCTPDTTGATCTLDQNSPNISANYSQPVTATIAWPSVSGQTHPSSRPFGSMPLVFAGLFAGLAFTTRRKRALAIALLLASMILTMASCGGGGGGSTYTPPPGPPPVTSKTYNFTIKVTSGSYSDSQVYSVVVNK